MVKSKFPVTRNFSSPACDSCMLSRSNNISTVTTKVETLSEKYGASTRDKYGVGDFSLLISLFVIIMDNYLLVMAESTHIGSFKAVLYTMMKLWVLFVLRTKSHLESTKLLWAVHSLINDFGNNM